IGWSVPAEWFLAENRRPHEWCQHAANQRLLLDAVAARNLESYGAVGEHLGYGHLAPLPGAGRLQVRQAPEDLIAIRRIEQSLHRFSSDMVAPTDASRKY